MAPKLPDFTSLSQVAAPAAEPGVKVPDIDYSPLVKSGAVLAKGMSSVGDAVAKFGNEANEREDFATRARFIDFKLHQDNAFQARERDGTLGGWDDEYTKNARDFFKTVPEREKAKYDLALTEHNAQFAARSRDALLRQQDSIELDTLRQKANDLLVTAQRDPSNLGQAKSDYDALVNALNLPADKKRELSRSANAAIEEAAFKGIDWRSNPAGAKAALGLDKSGQDTSAAGLLRRFEGFKSTPYWDVNADRVGYGSDTVTLADGTVKRYLADASARLADTLGVTIDSDVKETVPVTATRRERS